MTTSTAYPTVRRNRPSATTRIHNRTGDAGYRQTGEKGDAAPGARVDLVRGNSDGIVHGMRSTIDAAGRLVIPKELRRRAGIEPGIPLDIRWHNGHIEIEPASAPVRLERRGRFLVAVPEGEIEMLTAQAVEETREALRAERGSQSCS